MFPNDEKLKSIERELQGCWSSLLAAGVDVNTAAATMNRYLIHLWSERARPAKKETAIQS